MKKYRLLLLLCSTIAVAMEEFDPDQFFNFESEIVEEDPSIAYNGVSQQPSNPERSEQSSDFEESSTQLVPHKTQYQACCSICGTIIRCRDRGIMSVLNKHMLNHKRLVSMQERQAMIVPPIIKIFTIGNCDICGKKIITRGYYNAHKSPAEKHHKYRNHPGSVNFTFLRINIIPPKK